MSLRLKYARCCLIAAFLVQMRIVLIACRDLSHGLLLERIRSVMKGMQSGFRKANDLLEMSESQLTVRRKG